MKIRGIKLGMPNRVFVGIACVSTPFFSWLMYSEGMSLGDNVIYSSMIFLLFALQPTDHVDFD